MLYTVGEMAKVLGIPASTLRYYDKEGLLPFVERSSGGISMFTEKDYEWLNEGMSPLSQNVLHYSNPEGTLSKNN